MFYDASVWGVLKGAPPTMSVTRDRFCTVGTSTTVRCPEFRDVRYSGAVNIRTFSWYMDYCPLLGICPLLGVSVNGESTVIGSGCCRQITRDIFLSYKKGEPNIFITSMI